MKVDEWLAGFSGARSLPTKSKRVLDVIATQPRLASYGTTSDIARTAGVNNATVVRVAQALGFDGWLTFRQEIRSRYLASLSAPELADERAAGESELPAVNAIRQDTENLALLSNRLDVEAVKQFAVTIAGANRTTVIAAGSYGSVAMAFAHLATVMGYQVNAELRGGSHLANALGQLDEDSCLVTVALWRLHAEIMLAARVAVDNGVTVCAITDTTTSPLARIATHLIVVPSESGGWFPSLTASMSAVNALLTTMERLDGRQPRNSIARMEKIWHDMNLYHDASDDAQ
ncbi:MAG: MurR/RpiR family transcriptional regulator [Actinomycetota bacterium]|nr:MurR/RpiR family transcriptional regulator [Actinomycetota bacterium]